MNRAKAPGYFQSGPADVEALRLKAVKHAIGLPASHAQRPTATASNPVRPGRG